MRLRSAEPPRSPDPEAAASLCGRNSGQPEEPQREAPGGGEDLNRLPKMTRTASPIRNRHLVRELDRGRVRELLLVALLVVTLLLPLLGYVWNHMEYIRVGYEIEGLKRERVSQVELRERLRIEKSSLESLTRVERLAGGTLGLVPAAGSEVRLMEEPAPSLAMNRGSGPAAGE